MKENDHLYSYNCSVLCSIQKHDRNICRKTQAPQCGNLLALNSVKCSSARRVSGAERLCVFLLILWRSVQASVVFRALNVFVLSLSYFGEVFKHLSCFRR